MTPAQLKAARHALGLSARGMAAALSNPDAEKPVDKRTVRRWEDGSQNVPGPVMVAVEFMLAAQ